MRQAENDSAHRNAGVVDDPESEHDLPRNGSWQESSPEQNPRAGPAGRHARATPSAQTAVRRLLRRWLPESVLHSRVDPGRAGRLGIVLAALVALVVILVSAWGDRPVAEPAPSPPVPLPVPVAAPPPEASPQPQPEHLVVSVVGKVSRPGLVTVQPGDRVADALRAAGGVLPDTDITAVNLARKLVDGEQLYVAIPVPPGARTGADEPAPAPEPGTAGSKIDLNTATEEQLDALPGVGEVMAERIVQWRTQHGRFSSTDQLGDVEGIGDTRLARLRELVRV